MRKYWKVYERQRVIENVLIWFVWLLPRKIVYWSAIRVMVHATIPPLYGNQIVPDLTAMDALKRWDS